MINRQLFIDSFLATLLVFVVLYLFSIFPYDIKFLNPIKLVLKDFKYTDIYYSKIAEKDKPVEQEIVLVNIGNLPRIGIAELLSSLQTADPAVIGVDIMFYTRKDPLGDSLLKEELNKENVVVTHIIHDEGDMAYTLTSHPYFGEPIYAYANLVADDSLNSTIRYIRPFYNEKGLNEEAFTTKILEKYDEEHFNTLLFRRNKIETINYYGTYEQFVTYEGEDIIFGNFDPESIQDKIVLVGYMGNFIGDASILEDFKFTPLNHEVMGKTIPDMHGLTIHANILTMYINEQYIDIMPKWQSYFLAFFICYIHVVMFVFMFVRFHLWYHLFAKVIQFFTSALLVYIMFSFYSEHHLKIDTTLIVLTILISVDVLYLYETLAAVAYSRLKWKSYFISAH